MDDILRQVIGVYLQETREQTQRISQLLLDLESHPDPAGEQIEELFRQAHSLKGSSGSLGIGELEQLAHWLESALSAVRRGSEQLTAIQVDCGLRAMEAVNRRTIGLLEGSDGGLAEVQAATAELRRLAQASGSAAADAIALPAEPLSQSPAGSSDGVVSESEPGSGIEIADAVRISIDRLLGFERRSDELRALRGRLERQTSELGHTARLLEEVLRDLRSEGLLVSAGGQAIRDELVSLLRTVRKNRRDLAEDVETLQMTTSDLEDNLRALRLVPASLLVQPVQLAAREAARLLGRELQLVVTGDEVHLDRTLIEELKHPLLHLVRNAVDHGIEPTAVREAIGKPARGRINLSIAQTGSTVEIAVADDGRGIDPTVVRAKAVERGLLTSEAAEILEESEVYNLLLTPGFSTAQTVTTLSGRGVGLDVVKTAIERLHGQLDIQSTIGQGSRFQISLPMTVVASRLLLLIDRDWQFALPLSSVVRVVRVRRDRLQKLGGHTVYPVDGEMAVVAPLATLLGQNDVVDGAATVPLILLRSPWGSLVGLLCERIVGEYELILRALPIELGSFALLSAAALLPDGTAVFVLSPTELIVRSQVARPLALAPASGPGVILVADDSITTRSLLRSVLEVGGYQVRTAADGDEALRILRSDSIHLVVSDVRMPRLDGFTLVARLREGSRSAHIPVVLFSSSDSEEDRRRGMASGANAFLSKSAFDRGHLIDVVKGLLRGVA